MMESPLIEFRFVVEAELKQKATPAERKRLHDNPLLWLRVLIRLQHDVEDHIGKDNLRLSRMKPMPGEQPSSEYLREKRACASRTLSRTHFLGLVKSRRSEVAALCGVHPIPLVADVVDVLMRIMTLCNSGDVDGIRHLAQACAEKWAQSSQVE